MTNALNIVVLAGGKPAAEAQRNSGEYPDYLVGGGPKTLIEMLLESCTPLDPAKIVCLFSSEEISKYHLRNLLSQVTPLASVIPVHSETMGAACTALLAGGDIDNDEELLIIGSNELLDVPLTEIIERFRQNGADAGVVTFEALHPRYSFVKLNADGDVVESTEKNPISKNAIAGTFWFRKGSSFVRAAKNLIRKDTKTNGAFFIAPALNELILDGKRVTTVKIQPEQYQPLKTPAQLTAFEMGIQA
ncbi:glycosyltransferase family 2 protein [Pseudomonas aeruginosa]